jgi:hypothetical protein
MSHREDKDQIRGDRKNYAMRRASAEPVVLFAKLGRKLSIFGGERALACCVRKRLQLSMKPREPTRGLIGRALNEPPAGSLV